MPQPVPGWGSPSLSAAGAPGCSHLSQTRCPYAQTTLRTKSRWLCPSPGRDGQPHSCLEHGELQRDPQKGFFCSFHPAWHHPVGANSCSMQPRPHGQTPRPPVARVGPCQPLCWGDAGPPAAPTHPVARTSTRHWPWGAGTCVSLCFSEPQRAVTSAEALPPTCFLLGTPAQMQLSTFCLGYWKTQTK